jgi:tetratricopeptide (TPR) repeat protein
MDDDGSGQTRLTWDGQGDRAPQISPNGETIVYWSLAYSFQPDIWLINIDGSDKTRLTKSAYHDVYPSWSPDGNKIVFESDRAGNYDIFQISLDSSIDVDVEFEGCATSGSVSKAFITLKPSINAKNEIKVEKVELRFDWNNENEYIENLITFPYTLSDQNEAIKTEIDFSVPEDTKLGYHFYDVKVQYSESDKAIKIYEHSAGDLMIGTLEQHRCEVLYRELSIELERINEEAKSEGYSEYLLKPENEYFTKACDEYNIAKSLMMKGDYYTAKHHLERAKNILNQNSSKLSMEWISYNWLIMIALILVIIAILFVFWLPYTRKHTLVLTKISNRSQSLHKIFLISS